MNKERNKELIKRFNEAGLEEKILSLAEKAAKEGHYEQSIGLLDNLMHMGSKDKKLIANLAIKYQKALDNIKNKKSSEQI
jgi:hypothetical protein